MVKKMNFEQLFDKVEQMNPTTENREYLKQIISEYIQNDISFNFTNENVDLNDHLTIEQIDEIIKIYLK